jgi:hypothetical protein
VEASNIGSHFVICLESVMMMALLDYLFNTHEASEITFLGFASRQAEGTSLAHFACNWYSS